jgi:hypothetical protein
VTFPAYDLSGNIDHKPFTSFNKECQRYEKGHLEIGKNENKRRKIFNNVLNMNWDYVRGKKKTKGK